MAAKTYASVYYPALLTDAWPFQEALREREANNWDADRSPRGWTAIDAIRNAAGHSTTELPPALATFIRGLDLPEETKTNNVRRAVKDVWTWPLAGYLPWVPVAIEAAEPVTSAAQQILRDIRPALRLVEGKVYLMLPGFTAQLWRQFPELGAVVPGLARPLVRNLESDHVTVINSDCVLDPAAVREWLADYAPAGLKVTDLKHTISLDWALFSVCLVVGLASDGLAGFVAAYNERFGTKARPPSAHITVAIDPRATR